MDTLDKVLYQIRLHNLTDKAFEDYLGLSPKTVDSWKRGNSASYQKHISRIADFFGVSLDYLMRQNENQQQVFLSGNTLKKCRMGKKWTQDELSKALGVSLCVYSGWERSVTPISLAQLNALCTLLDTDASVILAKSEVTKNPNILCENPQQLPQYNSQKSKSIILRCNELPEQPTENMVELTPNEFEYLQDILQKIIKARL